jgi:Holliday junction resolvase RusA-like endonuclease
MQPMLEEPWTILLPYPPSQHRLWKQNPLTKKKFRTQEYEDWMADADHAALTQTGRLPRFEHPVILSAQVFQGKGFRSNGDGDNRLKAPVDWLVSRGVLLGDSWEHIPDWRIYLNREASFPRAMIQVQLTRAN